MDRVKKKLTNEGVLFEVNEVGDFSALRNYSKMLAVNLIEPFRGKAHNCKDMDCDKRYCSRDALYTHTQKVHPELLKETPQTEGLKGVEKE